LHGLISGRINHKFFKSALTVATDMPRRKAVKYCPADEDGSLFRGIFREKSANLYTVLENAVFIPKQWRNQPFKDA